MKRDSLGKKIRDLREEVGLTQEQLAKKTGLTARTVGSIERGRGCTLRTLRTLAKGLEIDSLELINEK